MRATDFVSAMYQCGVQSLAPLFPLQACCLGLILAFVGAVQLTQSSERRSSVAGLVGIGMLRVMGAVMVGVVMSGRIGAASMQRLYRQHNAGQ